VSNVDQQSVLIITDDAKFSRTLIDSWLSDPMAPAFALTSGDFSGSVPASSLQSDHDLAIIGPVDKGRFNPLLQALKPMAHPLVCVVPDEHSVVTLRSRHPWATFVRQHEDYCDTVVLLASEVLRRVNAMGRARRAEQLAGANEQYAALGRHALDMRHGLNNALTSVLGNAELILLDPGSLPSDVWEQLQTIHAMSLRMHEIVQRLTSLETEMILSERQSQGDSPQPQHTFVS
jgi:signal transduction histidine kinase